MPPKTSAPKEYAAGKLMAIKPQLWNADCLIIRADERSTVVKFDMLKKAELPTSIARGAVKLSNAPLKEPSGIAPAKSGNET